MRVTFNGKDLTKLHTRLESLSDDSKAKIKRVIQDTGAQLHEQRSEPMSDNLDQVIAECKKVDSGIARFMQNIFEETKQKLYPETDNEQRSETMETYSLPEALAKAKAKPGQLFKDKDGREVIFDDKDALKGWEYLYANGEKTFIRDTNLWYEEQPKPQPGEYWYSEVDDEYLLIKEHRYDKPYFMTDTSNHTHASQEAIVNMIDKQDNMDYYSCDTIKGGMVQEVPDWLSWLDFKRSGATKVTDKQSLKFLEVNRRPGEWRIGDLVYSKLSDNVGEIFKINGDESIGLRDMYICDKEDIFPVCFVEDRKDRGEST